MTKKKWILPVCIVAGIIVLLVAALLIIAAVSSAKGYGVTVGKLYFSNGNVFLVDGDISMIVSDQSKNNDLFSGYSSGDEIILVHDGVETSLPARTGGYFAFRISKGDGTYEPDRNVLGVEVIDDGREQPKISTPIEFNAQYIRTNGYHEDVDYPVVKVIRSVEELNEYYNENKDRYDLERKDKVYSDTTIGFLDACDRYDEAYFKNQILVMILLEEGSGSIRHKVESVGMGEDAKCYISINTIVPEVGTDDMAEWHILIEPEAGTLFTESDAVVLIDGINPKRQPTTVREAGNNANIALTVPYDWEYTTEKREDDGEFCIAFWPEGQSEGKIKVWFYEAFGVCGTGLVQEKITLGKHEAYKGIYDNKKVWDFISLIGTPGSYVVVNEGADAWWDEYGREAMQILNTLVVGEGMISEAEAIAIAKNEATVEYDQTRATFNSENGLWTVSLYKKNSVGGNQDITMTCEGKVIDIKYGE